MNKDIIFYERKFHVFMDFSANFLVITVSS